MANDTAISPWYIDTLGGITTNTKIIKDIVPIASAGTWSIILKDTAGHVVFSANNNAGYKGIIKSFPVVGLQATTLTAVAALIYFDNI